MRLRDRAKAVCFDGSLQLVVTSPYSSSDIIDRTVRADVDSAPVEPPAGDPLGLMVPDWYGELAAGQEVFAASDASQPAGMVVNAAPAPGGGYSALLEVKLAAWAAILAVPTAIAGIYGMNFDIMPELHWALGYPMAIIIMILVVVGLWAWFRKNHWL